MKPSLKIVQVIPALNTGGAERLVLDITNGLQKLGHEVFIITFRDGSGFSHLADNTQIEVIPSMVSYSIGGKNIIDTNDFDKRIREINPDIIHSHLLESELVSRHNPIPNACYITHWHGMHPPTNPRPISAYLTKDGWWKWNTVNQLKRNYAKCNNHFLCISNFIAAYVKNALNPDSELVNVILNGCNISEFGSYQLTPKSETFNLVSVGSFHTYKNQLFLLKVVLHLVNNGVIDIRLKLLGDGQERANLEAFCTENSLNNYVEFCGYVADPGLFMSQSDVLVHGAINEPFGLIFLEAMSMGLPTIAFRSGGIPEIVEDGKTGLLTDVNDVEGFASAILKIKNDSQLASQYGEEGKRAVQKFGMDAYVKNIEDLYYQLLKQD